MPWCKYPLSMQWMQMSPREHAMMQISFWWCAMTRMSHWCMLWCECTLVGVQWCECLFGDAMNVNAHLGMQWMQMPLCKYIMTQNALVQTRFIQKFLLFSKRGFHNAWNQNILKTWFIVHEESSSFWLKVLQKSVITVRNLRMRHWLRIWWSGSKDLFSQFSWAKGVARFQTPFFWKNEFFENQAS